MSTSGTHGFVSSVIDGTLAAIVGPSFPGQTAAIAGPSIPHQTHPSLVPAALQNPWTDLCRITTGDTQVHIICVNPQEDVWARLMTLAQVSGRNMIILSGSGSIASAMLGTSGLTTVYEAAYGGAYQLSNLSGSIRHEENLGLKTRVCILTVTMGGPDGRAIVGCLAGHLIADSNVEVIAISYQKEPEASALAY